MNTNFQPQTPRCGADGQSHETEGPSPDFSLNSYDFELPQELIAQEPPRERGASRLMVLDRATGEVLLTEFSRLAEYLDPNTLFVANNSKVIPARMQGLRQSGGRAEFLLLTPLPLIKAVQNPQGGMLAAAEGLLRSSKQIKQGELVNFGPLIVRLEQRGEYGRCKVTLFWNGDLADILDKSGSLPLPPYIRRNATNMDADRYQTIYAAESKKGSVAAPTAGLHFTEETRRALLQNGHSWAELTLYVGYGTFSPVRSEDIRQHEMHSEYMELPTESAQKILKVKAEGGKILAVGTTAARALESAAQAAKGVLGTNSGLDEARGSLNALANQPENEPDNESVNAPANASNGAPLLGAWSGWTDIFLYPGRPIAVVDQLLTNFHLPQSSLLMLISAFAGRERVLKAYKKAVEEKMRFFSYGDAMLIR